MRPRLILKDFLRFSVKMDIQILTLDILRETKIFDANFMRANSYINKKPIEMRNTKSKRNMQQELHLITDLFSFENFIKLIKVRG